MDESKNVAEAKERLMEEMEKFEDLNGNEALVKIVDVVNKRVQEIQERIQKDIRERLDSHKKWLDSDQKEGFRFKMNGKIKNDLFRLHYSHEEFDNMPGIYSSAVIRSSVSFRDADLRKADFKGASFKKVDLYGSNLSGADLRNTDLRGSELTASSLEGALLQGAVIDEGTGIQKKSLIKSKGFNRLEIEDGDFKKQFEHELKLYLILNKKIQKKGDSNV